MSSSLALSESQREQLATFQSVTNMADEARALSLMESHGWNLEAAIGTALAIQQHDLSAPSPTLSSPSQSQSLSHSNYAHPQSPTADHHAPLLSSSPSISPQSSSSSSSHSHSHSQSYTDWINSYPLGWLVTGAWGVVTSLIRVILPSAFIGPGPTRSGSSRRPLADSSINRELSARFPHWPPFVDATYPAAVRDSKRTKRLLLIYLHDSTSECERFCSETLATESINNFVRENFVAWMGSVHSTDGARLQQTLRAARTPFIALLAPHQQQLAVLYRHSGTIGVDDLIHALLVKLEDHAAFMSSISTATGTGEPHVEDARSIRETQDAEYEEALRKDREMVRQRDEAEAKAREEARLLAEAEDKARIEAEQQKQKEEQLKRIRQDKLASLGIEPPASTTTSTVSVRLVDGTRVQRRFDSTNQIGKIFDWIEAVSEHTPIIIKRVATDGTGSVGGQYQLVSNFPRSVYSNPDALLSETKLGKQAVLFVEEIVVED